MDKSSSIDKAIQILTLLRCAPYSANLTLIATKIGMTKPGALKTLRILEENAFIRKDANTKQYSLGPALLRLGNVYREQKGITDIAHPILRHLTSSTLASAYITIWDKDEAFLLLLEESPKGPCYALKGDAVFGDSIPIHTGASAKLLAAHQDPALVNAILDTKGLERKGSRTIVDREKLSVPIPEADGAIRWALSISGYKTWLKREELLDHLPLLKNGAKQIALKFGFRL